MNLWTDLARFSFFETENYWLRPLTFLDRKDFFDITGNPKNMAFIFPAQKNLTESDFLLANYFLKNPLGIWAIEDKKEKKMLGIIRLENIVLASKEAELGYFLHSSFWGQGVMTEVVKAIVSLSFLEFGLKRLRILCHDENKGSQRVAEKSGFRCVKHFKGSDRYTHQMRWYREYIYNQKDYPF